MFLLADGGINRGNTSKYTCLPPIIHRWELRVKPEPAGVKAASILVHRVIHILRAEDLWPLLVQDPIQHLNRKALRPHWHHLIIIHARIEARQEPLFILEQVGNEII